MPESAKGLFNVNKMWQENQTNCELVLQELVNVISQS